MKKYNLILGIILTVIIIIASHYDYKWQTQERLDKIEDMQEYFNTQAEVLLDAYHIDSIEEDEYDTLYNKLCEYDSKNKLYSFDAESEIAALN